MNAAIPLLTVDHLSFSFRGKPVLKDLSFEVDKGSFTAVIGPNGCGKTTLVRLLLKSLGPASGQIRLLGEDHSALSNQNISRRMAAVLQTIDPVPMTVREYVLLGRMPFFARFQFFESKKDMAIAEQYMALTGISHLADKKVTQVSGGERQLCAIARALTQEPVLLLLDEPTAHLDITHQKRILDLITALKQRLGLTVLMVLHDLNLAAEYADCLVLLQKLGQSSPGCGRIRWSSIYRVGPPERVMTADAVNQVYQTRVTVCPNPVSKKPWIVLTQSDQSTHRENTDETS